MRPGTKKLLALAGGVIVLLGLWEILVALTEIPEYLLPRPSVVAERFLQTLPVQLEHLGVTAMTTLSGLGLAFTAGLLLALVVIYVQPLESLVVQFFAAFNGIPKIAVAPLFVTWFGLGSEPKILLAFLMGLFPIFVSAVSGLGEIEPDLIDLARLSGGSELAIFRKVRLMHALPYLTDALKVAFPLALVGSIVGEFIGGNRGIGYLVLSGQSTLDTPLVFASLLSITLFTAAGIGLVALVEELALGWRPSRRERG